MHALRNDGEFEYYCITEGKTNFPAQDGNVEMLPIEYLLLPHIISLTIRFVMIFDGKNRNANNETFSPRDIKQSDCHENKKNKQNNFL